MINLNELRNALLVPAKHSSGMLTVKDIGERLGITPLLLSYIMHTHQIRPTAEQGRAKLFTEAQFQELLASMIQQLSVLQEVYSA